MRASTRTQKTVPAQRPLTRKQVIDLLRRGRSLEQADIRGLDLSGINFDGVNLRWTKLADADLSQCSFRGADLTSASMWHANLKDCAFDDAVLDGADLDCANIDGACFKGARIRKTIFPIPRTEMHQVMESVRTGSPVRVDPSIFEDEG